MAAPSKGKTTDGRPMPTLDLQEVSADDLPPAPVSKRRMAYFDLLMQIVDSGKSGQMFQVGEYQSENGASNVASDLGKGYRPFPGDLGDWEFEHRKVDVDGERKSRLYATYNGGALTGEDRNPNVNPRPEPKG